MTRVPTRVPPAAGPDYGCATLQQFFASAPGLKEKLEVIREGLGK